MAIRNFILPDTYTVVAPTYDKHGTMVELRWTTYSDASKTVPVSGGSILCDGRVTHIGIRSASAARPEAGASGDYYIADGQLFVWIPENGSWGGSPLNKGQTFFLEDTGEYVLWTGTQLVPQPQAFDSRKWDEWFGVDKIQGVDAEGRPRDLLRRAYEYLMSRAEFSACTET